MSISLNFELNDRDLEHFEKAMANAKEAAKDRTADDIVMCTGKLLEDAAKVHIPDFIKERLLRLDDMIAMVRDEGWHLPEEDRQRVLSALVYFCDPKDIANLVLFLASDESRFVSGAEMRIDNAYSVWGD